MSSAATYVRPNHAPVERDNPWEIPLSRHRPKAAAADWAIDREAIPPRWAWSRAMSSGRQTGLRWKELAHEAGGRDEVISISTPASADVILAALASPRYLWRTVDGIAKETKSDADTVQAVINANADQIVRSTHRSVSGAVLYTTRDHFRVRAPVWEKLRGALKLRID